MNRVTLIQCTDSKRDEMALARDLYDESRYFRRMREWAESRGNSWFILSAKHGLVDPDESLEPYDEYGLSSEQAWQIATELSDRGIDVVDITAGREYTDPLIPALEFQTIDAVNHFAGEPIGRREKLLRQATAERRHDTL